MSEPPTDAVKWWKEDIKKDRDRKPMTTVLGDANGYWGVCDEDDCLWVGITRYSSYDAYDDALAHQADEHSNKRENQ